MNARRGRPRDPRRDAAILDAARTVIANRGYTGATMEEIALTAGVGKDTLYRRWSSKGPLVIDVIETMAREAARPAPLEIDPYFNLFVYLKDVVRLYRTTDFGPIVAGLVGESARNADLAAAFKEFWSRRRGIAAPLVLDIVGASVSEADLEAHLDHLFGPIYLRLLLTGADVSDEFLWDLVVATTSGDGTPPTPHPGDAERPSTSEPLHATTP